MLDKARPDLSEPFDLAIGSSGPVQRILGLLHVIVSKGPKPAAASEEARSAAVLVAVHLLHLMRAVGGLNGAGFHSAAVALFRPIEDALDCFGAVSLVNGAAEQWLRSDLKPSDAAKMWVEWVEKAEHFEHAEDKSLTLSDYRKMLRSHFSMYSHCSPVLADWNLYVAATTGDETTLALNIDALVINRNAHAIDAHLTASAWEFMDLAELAFEEHLSTDTEVQTQFRALKEEVQQILECHREHGCLDVLGPPEVGGDRGE